MFQGWTLERSLSLQRRQEPLIIFSYLQRSSKCLMASVSVPQGQWKISKIILFETLHFKFYQENLSYIYSMFLGLKKASKIPNL